MFDLLKTALSKGIKTSEFWLALAAMFVPLIDAAVQRALDYITNAQSATHNPVWMIVLAGAAAFISAAYSIARSLVKREQVRQLPTAAALDGYTNTNRVIPDGTADAERAHAIRAGADPSQLGGA